MESSANLTANHLGDQLCIVGNAPVSTSSLRLINRFSNYRLFFGQVSSWNLTAPVVNPTSSLRYQLSPFFDLSAEGTVASFEHLILRVLLCYQVELLSVVFLLIYLFNYLLFASISSLVGHVSAAKSQSHHGSLPTAVLTTKRVVLALQLSSCFVELVGFVTLCLRHQHFQASPGSLNTLLAIFVRLLALGAIGQYHFRLRSPLHECPGHIVISLFWLTTSLSLLVFVLATPLPLIDHPEGATISLFGLCHECIWTPPPSSSSPLSPPPAIFNRLDYLLIVLNLFLSLVQFVLCFFSNFRLVSTYRVNPETRATFFARLLFIWLDSTIYRGWRQQLTRDDIFELCESDRVETSVGRFERLLLQPSIMFESVASSKNRRLPQLRLIQALVVQYRWQLLKIVFIKIFPTLLVFLGPIYLDRVIAFIKRDPITAEPLWHGYLYVGLMFSVALIESILNSLGDYHINKLALQVRSCLMATIYDRLVETRRRWAETRRFPIGSIVNTMSIDTQRVMDLVRMINLVWICPLQVGISIWLLWSHLGYGSLAGLGVLFALLPFNTFIGAKMRSLQKRLLASKDSRLKRLNEALANMVAVKLYAWEEFFMRRIFRWREAEVKNLRRQAVYSAFITFAFNSAPFFVALASFTLYTLIDSNNRLDARKIFVSMSIFNIIRRPLAFFPQLITTGMMFLVSLKRITDFLELESFHFPSTTTTSASMLSTTQSTNTLKSLIIGNRVLKPRLCLRECTLRWPTWFETREPQQQQQPELSQTDFALHDLHLEIDHPQLVAIIGEVGSGKSSLLAALQNQMMSEVSANEEFVVEGRIAYVPQTAWIQNASIRENILFGTPYDAQRYRRTLSACALLDDLRHMKEGDATLVGDKGASLSGGQKLRISIARAVYREADIYLLDDPLSALDAHVSKHIFEHVFGPSGLLASKIRLLVTTKYNFLAKVDNILLLSKGHIIARGSYDELTAEQDVENEFVQFLASWLISSSQANSEINTSDSEATETGNEKEDDDDEDYEELKEIATRLERRFSSFSRRGSKVWSRKSTSSSSTSSTTTEASGKSKSAQSSGKKCIKRTKTKCAKLVRRKADVNTSTITSSSSSHSEEPSQCQTSLWLVGFRYVQHIGLLTLTAILVLYTLGHILVVASNVWLSDWSNSSHSKNMTLIEQKHEDAFYRLSIYALLGVSQTLFILIGTWLLNIGCLRASAALHTKALGAVFRTPISFFELTPLGQVLNRLTKDVDTSDVVLISSVRLFAIELFRTVASMYIIYVGTRSLLVLLLFVPLIGVYSAIYKFYIRASRQLARLEAQLRTPIYSLFSETYSGLPVVHAFEAVGRFRAKAQAAVDENTSAGLMIIATARWLNIRLEFLGNLVVLVTAWFCILYHDMITPGMAGLALYSALTITSTLNLLVRSSTELENNLVSIERLVEYTQLEQESCWHSTTTTTESSSREVEVLKRSLSVTSASTASMSLCPSRTGSPTWLQTGDISFFQYSARYRPGRDLCLREINLHIAHGTRVGIVGRTGAGKSSFANALFRYDQPKQMKTLC